eukprot:CAMPEP_0185577274 /NCGR_PEP_ID=MMETSP0434-20130131/9543_1 /TAXON_ID=626734 ORGANISM="Favella taraikaensis, Strain Fe Narragansett Bay" /NCGR_SAMPLE_ID=MMETSP0434 /ASSEMBLY_ACC=CAM_ASM_000379 /LENGTH=121 /DNA_ID=CAMNT_0028194793 /DNA_START=425 /DNA_END=791 /DNA_ORIENTATION=-
MRTVDQLEADDQGKDGKDSGGEHVDTLSQEAANVADELSLSLGVDLGVNICREEKVSNGGRTSFNFSFAHGGGLGLRELETLDHLNDVFTGAGLLARSQIRCFARRGEQSGSNGRKKAQFH